MRKSGIKSGIPALVSGEILPNSKNHQKLEYSQL